MIPSSFVIVFAVDDTQGKAVSFGKDLISVTSSGASHDIPLSTEEQDETQEHEKSSSPLRVAFVKPSFTFAAYQLNGFYNFYEKYRELPYSAITNVTTDLNLLTVGVPDRTYTNYKDDPSDPPRVPLQEKYMDTLKELVEQKASSENLDIDIEDISDKEVHEGNIFDSAGNNAYDVLFLFHQEYVTQAEYDNLRKFVVQNGGTIVFNDANIFTVEIKYDSASNTITLVRGHGWAYDDSGSISGGSSAWHAERERWLDENQLWVGSNFMQIPANENVTFSNNPFNYDHSEEQIVTNPNAKIIFDFGVTDNTPYRISNEIDDDNNNNSNQQQHFPDFGKVATYEMISGKGKVINIGIFAHKLVHNEAFLEFYDQEILSRMLG